MTFNNLTREDATRLRDAIMQLEAFEQSEITAQNVIDNKLASDWWNTVKPDVPTTRQEALGVFNFIKTLLETETDSFRLALLREKQEQANEKFKEIKRNG